jgi:hypothetical protein
MATTTYLSNPDVKIGAVSLSDQCTSAVLTRTIEALESTAFGSTSRVYTAGLENNTLELELYMSYAASETYATLKSLVGTSVVVTVSPSATSPGTATNPTFTLTGTYIESLPVINASLGALGTLTLSMQGGVYSVVEA